MGDIDDEILADAKAGEAALRKRAVQPDAAESNRQELRDWLRKRSRSKREGKNRRRRAALQSANEAGQKRGCTTSLTRDRIGRHVSSRPRSENGYARFRRS